WMKKAIKHDYPRAVGELYYVLRDLGGENNQKEILTWLRIAAEKGDPWAQTTLGSLAESPEERLSWIQNAAAQNYSEGLFALAYIYEYGIDVKRNLSKATFYYCVLQFNSTARRACSNLGKGLSEPERKEISAQVQEWLEHNAVYYFTDPLFD